MSRVTVARTEPKGSRTALGMRYAVTFDALPGKTFGPWGYDETCRDLTVSAALEPVEARALVLDAWADGVASRAAGGAQ